MKQLIIPCLIGFIALAIGIPVQASPAMGDAAKEVAAMEQLWAQAETANDVALEATYLADTLVTIGFDGAVNTKEHFLADERKTKYTKVTADIVKVQVYGSAAVASYVLTMKGTDSDGKPMDLRANATDTWVKAANGKWQCVASVTSAIKK